jgi:hypothetical protein
MSYNIGTIGGKETELMQVLEREGVDIAFIQEAELKDFDVTNPYSLPGFQTFTYLWGTKKTTITLVKHGSMRNAEIDKPLMLGLVEVWLKLTLINGKKIRAGNMNREWRNEAEAETCATYLCNLLSQVDVESLETVMAGDFNLDFKDKNYHKRGLALRVSSEIKASGFHLYGFNHTFRRTNPAWIG